MNMNRLTTRSNHSKGSLLACSLCSLFVGTALLSPGAFAQTPKVNTHDASIRKATKTVKSNLRKAGGATQTAGRKTEAGIGSNAQKAKTSLSKDSRKVKKEVSKDSRKVEKAIGKIFKPHKKDKQP
jgi:hypothetical protein